MKVIKYKEIEYIAPRAKVLHLSPITQSEIGARVCYDSFCKSPHDTIREYSFESNEALSPIDNSDLLENLSHVLHHESILEHTTVTFHLTDVARGVLQELARHRIASYSVRSTRYTMGELLIRGFVYCMYEDINSFSKWISESGIIVVSGAMGDVISMSIATKLFAYINHVGASASDLIFSKDQIEILDDFILQDKVIVVDDLLSSKMKRNVGDAFKFLVDDMWATEIVMTINLRSLKNFMKLRLSSSTWFLMRELAHDMLAQLPTGYRQLIIKKK